MSTDHPDLRPLLERATDRIEASPYVATALARARQRRARRRAAAVSLVAAAAVAGAVAGVVVGVGVSRPEGEGARLPAERPEPSPTTSAPVQVAEPVILPRWDPFTVEDAPVRETVLPIEVDPPASAPSVLEQPIGAAVLAWPSQGRDLLLLGTDGGWRSVPDTADPVGGTTRLAEPALTHDGRMLAHPTDAGVLVVDLAAGERRTVAWPGRLAGPWDWPPELRWLPGGEEIAVLDGRGTWLVGLAGAEEGVARRAPYGGEYGAGLAIDPAGPVVHRRWEEQDLRVFDGDALVSEARFWHWGDRLVAGHGLAAMSGGGGGLPGDGGPMVVDPVTGAVVGYAPIRDPNAVYTDNGHLRPQGFLDEDTVLLLVGPMDFATMELGEESWHLVAWDFLEHTFTRLTTGDASMVWVEVAVGALAADW